MNAGAEAGSSLVERDTFEGYLSSRPTLSETSIKCGAYLHLDLSGICEMLYFICFGFAFARVLCSQLTYLFPSTCTCLFILDKLWVIDIWRTWHWYYHCCIISTTLYSSIYST